MTVQPTANRPVSTRRGSDKRRDSLWCSLHTALSALITIQHCAERRLSELTPEQKRNESLLHDKPRHTLDTARRFSWSRSHNSTCP